jgi:hypothetical protein
MYKYLILFSFISGCTILPKYDMTEVEYCVKGRDGIPRCPSDNVPFYCDESTKDDYECSK